MDLWTAHPRTLIETLRRHDLRRAYLLTRDGEVRASHPALQPLADAVAADTRDYHGHVGVFFELGRESGQLLSAAIHKTHRGQAAGGVRYWTYDTVEAFVRDGLRLARGMGHKNALAGLWWGGGKGVVLRLDDTPYRDLGFRRKVYEDYGRFITGLRGCYVTAEDAGTTAEDMAHVFRTTRHTTCIPPELGGSGNPSEITAAGVVVGMEAALHHLGLGDLGGKTVAMQGVGNVSRFMIQDLLARGVGRIVATEVSGAAIEAARATFPAAPLEITEVPLGDTSVLSVGCDVLAPNAVGGVLNARTIPGIRAPVICGAANNQLEDPERDAAALGAHGALYAPDFLVNRMGIVSCANEASGVFPGDPHIRSHLARDTEHGIFQRSLEVYARAKAGGAPPAVEAQRLADELGEELHPMWGDRARQIVDALVEEGWDRA